MVELAVCDWLPVEDTVIDRDWVRDGVCVRLGDDDEVLEPVVLLVPETLPLCVTVDVRVALAVRDSVRVWDCERDAVGEGVSVSLGVLDALADADDEVVTLWLRELDKLGVPLALGVEEVLAVRDADAVCVRLRL